MPSAYDLNDLIHACGKTDEVIVSQNSVASAFSDFGLNTKTELLAFIANHGLEKTIYINSKPWKNNHDIAHPVMVDAYSFYSGPKHGYMAFLLTPTEKWLIKSFKLNIDLFPPAISPMQEQLADIKNLMSLPEEK